MAILFIPFGFFLLPKIFFNIIKHFSLLILSASDQGYVADEGYVSDQGYVADQGYSGSVSCSLNYISTILFF